MDAWTIYLVNQADTLNWVLIILMIAIPILWFALTLASDGNFAVSGGDGRDDPTAITRATWFFICLWLLIAFLFLITPSRETAKEMAGMTKVVQKK